MNDNTSTTSTLILLPQEVVQTTIEVVADGFFYEKTIDNITLEMRENISLFLFFG